MALKIKSNIILEEMKVLIANGFGITLDISGKSILLKTPWEDPPVIHFRLQREINMIWEIVCRLPLTM